MGVVSSSLTTPFHAPKVKVLVACRWFSRQGLQYVNALSIPVTKQSHLVGATAPKLTANHVRKAIHNIDSTFLQKYRSLAHANRPH